MTLAPPPTPLPPDEAERLAALRRYEILDTPPEEAFDRLARLAAQLLGVPVALVSLVDADRQWFKSRRGLDLGETPRRVAFCAHTILADEVLVVEDARADPRFARNPLVADPAGVRFYAGAPVTTPDGYRIGSAVARLRVERVVAANLVEQRGVALRPPGRHLLALGLVLGDVLLRRFVGDAHDVGAVDAQVADELTIGVALQLGEHPVELAVLQPGELDALKDVHG